MPHKPVFKPIKKTESEKTKKLSLIFRVFIIAVALFLPISQTFATIDQDTLLFYSKNNILYYDPTGRSTDCTPYMSTKPSSNQITWIGDSYSVAADNLNLFNDKLPDADKHIQGSKTIDRDTEIGGQSGLSILTELANSNSLRDYIVFALGTNVGNDDIASLDKVVSLIEDRIIILVTPRTHSGINYNNVIQKMNSLAASHQNVIIADWASNGYDDKYFESDNIHPYDNGGIQAWFDLIINTIPGGTSRIVSGENTIDLVWNYLSNTNLFSDAQIAGIIGNILTEIGGYQKGGSITEEMLNVNPLYETVGSSFAYLFQWDKSANYDKINGRLSVNYSKYVSTKYHEQNTDIPIDDKAGIIEVLIKYALEVGGGASLPNIWIKEVQAQTTPAAAAEAFLVSFEGATETQSVPGQAIQFYKDTAKGDLNRRRANTFRYQGRDKRVEAAEKIYELYTGKANNESGNVSGFTSNSVLNPCTESIAVAGSIISYIQQYIIDLNYFYDYNITVPSSLGFYNNTTKSPYVGIERKMTSMSKLKQNALKDPDIVNFAVNDFNVDKTSGAGFGGATYNEQCTAVSGWFVTMFTSYKYAGGAGGKVVSNLSRENNVDYSPVPVYPSIFSYEGVDGGDGHTGVVLDYDSSTNEITTIEGNWGKDEKNYRKLITRKFDYTTLQQAKSDSWIFFPLSGSFNTSHLGTTYE